MVRLQTYKVFPSIPNELSFLEELSMNLWWCWHYDAVELFRRIDPVLWEEHGERNPVKFLTLVAPERLRQLARNDSFLSHQQRVRDQFVKRVRLPAESHGDFSHSREVIAYFSMEFGLHESIPLFAGGLGVLAGDHLKAASNMALPLVGIGLLYREGYFRQYLDQNGWQQESYPNNDLFQLPIRKVRDSAGRKVQIAITGPEGPIAALVWEIQVGCISLYLLDTNVPENPPGIRIITARLYPSDPKVRLAQEILLGIGGMRALRAMNLIPRVCHMNEGHSAFAGLERLAQMMERLDIDLATAMEIVPRTTLFTTHTPVAAGHDEFPIHLVRPYVHSLKDRLTLTEEEIVGFGQSFGEPARNAPLSMFMLALRLAGYCNGVSRLHGRVARRMWAHLWPGRPEDEIPITHVTNGVHVCSYISREYALLFDRYLGPEWFIHPWKTEIVERINDIYDEELWHAHEIGRARLIRETRRHMVNQYRKRNAPMECIKEMESLLDNNILTICFARRFATYKRANLLLMDPERLEAMITSEKYPVQFIFAGKAHPRDDDGKRLIRRLIEFAARPAVRHRVAFIEDYDINISRMMVQGGDVWLNTPRRPFEACGTSGMKAAANGVLNVSILDGWWCEGYSPQTGWKIGNGDEFDDQSYQDTVEGHALYNILENEVIPTYYNRKNGKSPLQWIRMMKASMKMAMQNFCSHRMVMEYNDLFYKPMAHRMQSLTADNAREAVNMLQQRKRLLNLWKGVQVISPVKEGRYLFRVGDTFQLSTTVHLGELKPHEVDVELYYGLFKSVDTLVNSHTETMTVKEARGDGQYIYTCTITCQQPGRFGFTTRVTPRGDHWTKFFPGLISWAHT
jgi:starch phosphorylase